MDEEAVAAGVEKIHNSKVAPNFYNNEQALRSTIRLAYLGAIDHYIEIQELASGKGYADLVLIPRRNTHNPLLVIELKWNKTAEAAIDQIKDRNYPEILQPLAGEILLVGINYDKDTKKHNCIIEKFTKDQDWLIIELNHSKKSRIPLEFGKFCVPLQANTV